MALTPEDYKRKLRQMTQYIIQQGYEKAEEVDTKGEEEFKIAKGKLVHASQININEEYVIRENQVLRKVKINTCKIALQHKLQILDKKNSYIELLRTQVHEKIAQDMENIGHRAKILYLLILEGLYKLLENTVKIRCKRNDISIITSLLSSLRNEYKQHTNQDVSLIIDSQYLNDSVLGGVYIFARNNRIFLENTLESRVDKVIRRRIPVLNNIWYNLPKRI